MTKLFVTLLDNSLIASYLIIAVILARIVFKKAPKIISYSLWSLVFVKLLIPFKIESPFSLVRTSPNIVSSNIETMKRINNVEGGDAVSQTLPQPSSQALSIDTLITIIAVIWVTVTVYLLIKSLLTTRKLNSVLSNSRMVEADIFENTHIETAFVFGIFNPIIYIPSGLSESEKNYILEHERTHLRRKDHIIKFVSHIISMVYCFNPLVWLAFHLMVKDMEESCDEAVIARLGEKVKVDYSQTLLNISSPTIFAHNSPVCFAENNTKTRVDNVLKYKKPKRWIYLVGLLVFIALGVLFMTQRNEKYPLDTYRFGQYGKEDFLELEINRDRKSYAFVAGYKDPHIDAGDFEEDGDKLIFTSSINKEKLELEKIKGGYRIKGESEKYPGLSKGVELKQVYAFAKQDNFYLREPRYGIDGLHSGDENVLYADEDLVLYDNPMGAFLIDIKNGKVIDSFAISDDRKDGVNYYIYELSADKKSIYVLVDFGGVESKDMDAPMFEHKIASKELKKIDNFVIDEGFESEKFAKSKLTPEERIESLSKSQGFFLKDRIFTNQDGQDIKLFELK